MFKEKRKRNMEASGTVILFYKYVNVDDAENERTIQKQWWEELNISGRMRLSKEGVNANLYGLKENIEEYKNRMNESIYWNNIDYKHTKPLKVLNENDIEDPFNGVRKIRVSDEITGSGPMKNFLPTALGGQGGTHLKPSEFDNLVKQSLEDDSVVIIDTRNHYETVVGKFKNAVDPKLRCFGEFPGWIEANKDSLKNKKIGLYCTGGIRCEKASAFVKSLNVADEVYQLEGGIHNYLSEFSQYSGKESGVFIDKSIKTDEVIIKKIEKGSNCIYEGVNFQFDNRFSEETCGLGENKLKGSCSMCLIDTKDGIKEDSRCSVCDNLILTCEKCYKNYKLEDLFCPEHRLLSDSWKEYLTKLLETKWTIADLKLTLKALKLNLNVPVYKQCNGWKVDRIEDLNKQIERVTQFISNLDTLDEDKSKTTLEHSTFVPYIPFLNP